MEKKQLIKKLEGLNKTKMIKVTGTDKERLVFTNEETFKLFGKVDSGVLEPFNDYTYVWLSDFLTDLNEFLEGSKNDLNTALEDFKEHISEYVDNRTDVYTSDLTEWLHDRNGNVSYLTDALEEHGVKDGFKALQMAQYKAIEELYYNALSIIEKEFLK